MALDDFVWSLQRSKLEALKDAAEYLRSRVLAPEIDLGPSRLPKPHDPNKQFLIGALPHLLQDRKLFPENEDIAEFANTVLELGMTRTEKRSRYEIVGKVICETDGLDEGKLTTLVAALGKVVGNKDRLNQMIEKKRKGTFSWNETLQELLKI